MTPDGGAYEVLGDVSRAFLPIRVKAFRDPAEQDHVAEFLSLVHNSFLDCVKKGRPNPIVAIAPVFYGMRDWVKPERDKERTAALQFVTTIADLQERLDWQYAFTKARGGRGGFTSTVVDVVNDNPKVKRVIVIVRIGQDKKAYKHGKDLCLTINVPSTIKEQYTSRSSLSPQLHFQELKVPEEADEPWKGNRPKSIAREQDKKDREVAAKELQLIYPLNDIVQWTEADEFTEEERASVLERASVVQHASEHSLYIDEHYSLVYVFSNVVQVKTEDGDYQRGCGGLFIVVKNEALNDPDLTWLYQAKSLSDKLANRVIHDAQLEEIVRQSRAAAISQVLARTLSHNLGSHSLNAFSGEPAMLGQFQEIEYRKRHHICLPGRICSKEESCVTQAIPCLQEDRQFAPVKRLEAEELSKHRRELLATYNNYLRERMDLLADITTAVPAFEMPKQLVADLLEGYARNLLLATTIAGTGGRFRYCWQPDIQTGDGKDVNVAIPSDVLGAHAFYLILENIVRNSAKHGGHSEEVVFTVQVTEPEVEAWKRKGLLRVQITENCTELEKNQTLVNDRNASINAPVLDEKTRRVRDKGWGTLEMKAACAYLRRVALEELDEKKYQAPVPAEKDEEKAAKKDPEGDEPPLLKAIGDPAKNEHFGYEFYLMRPKLVMVCSDEGTDEAVIKTANLNQDGANSLQDHGIGAMTLDELEAITKGERKEVVNHALLVFLAKGEADLKRFIHAALQDLAALPHEMVIVGCEKCDAKAFQTLLTATKAELKGDGNGKLSPASIDHNASILERSVVWMERSMWQELSSQEPEKLYMEVRHRWLVGWMDCLKISINKVPRVYSQYLTKRLNCDLTSSSLGSIYVDYQAHADFYGSVKGRLELKCPDKALPVDLSPFLILQRCKSQVGEHAIVQRYPDALSRIMTLGWKDKPDPSDKLTKPKEIQVLAQHHLASWTKGVAVIDERVQGCAENDTYQPEATELNPNPSAIRIKDLLCMGAVFVPPSSIIDLQRSDAFTAELWEALVEKWLSPLQGVLGYVCVHLTLLEKFSKSMEMNVEELLDVLRSNLSGIRIIVVSGRGKPPELPKTELFMSYSALSQYTTQTFQRAPVLLNLLAHNTRRIIL